MIDFIILDDEKTIRDTTKKIINRLMMPYDIAYNIKVFEDYSIEMKNIIEKNEGIKIYILDIELPSKSGIDIARKIREKDWESIIIFLTAHYDLGLEAIKNRLMLLDFISKFNNYKDNLKKVLEICLKIVGKKRVLSFTNDKNLYRLKLEDICYIFRDSVERKTIVKTASNSYMINKPISEIAKELDCRFFQTHRSCIVNKDHISEFDSKNRIILFRNNESIDTVSRDKKKGLREHVGSNK
jgi:two-component system, LytTR family, response regulator AgrA